MRTQLLFASAAFTFVLSSWGRLAAGDEPDRDAPRITFAVRHEDEFGLLSLSVDEGSGRLVLRSRSPVVEPAWSPDGQKLAYVSFENGPGQICVLDIKTQTTTKLTNAKDWERNPSWSPDGSQIAFTSRRDGHEQIYLMKADGSEQRNISNNDGFDADPTWSPDGKQIAFASMREGQSFRLFVMNEDGSNQRALSDKQFLGWVFPDWSPNGKFIAMGEYETNRNVALVLFELESQRFIDVVRGPGCHTFSRWSPDGRYLAFARYDSPPNSYRPGDEVQSILMGDLMIFDADANGVSMLVENAVPGWGPRPSWQPARIAAEPEKRVNCTTGN